jgi:transposase
MAKYSEEFKLKIVYEYTHGPLGYPLLAKKYNMPSSTPIQEWVRSFNEFGVEGLKRRKKKRSYPVQFKKDVLHFMKQTGASYSETATAFGLNNSSVVVRWNKEFQEGGIEGLNPKPKGRPSMSKKKKKQEENELRTEEQLRRENELLRLENAYLKKLKAFKENPNAFLEKHKQQWHSNSNKKDSN